LKSYEIKTPVSDDVIKHIEIGDFITITGEIILARDEAHKRALEYVKKNKELPFKLDNAILYHAGPIAKLENENWKIIALGPTTSTRMEMFEPEFIKNFNIKIILGKGGMTGQTITAFKKYKVLYGAITGGTSLIWARKIVNVENVEWLDLGIPEALWKIKVNEFGPILVAIDSNGRSIFDKVREEVLINKKKVQKFLKIS
jgi:fumarate hydratase subunit beta